MNGKQKGSQFERDICKKLSLWISNNQNENLLWRSAMSGGRSTVMGKQGKANKEQCGDISAVGEEGHLLTDKVYLELKFYKDLGLKNFFIGETSKLTEFWKTTVKNADTNDKIPLMVVKENRYPAIVITTRTFFKKVVLARKGFFKTEIGPTPIVVGTLENFLESFIIRSKEISL